MTVPSETARDEYTGDGVTVSFPYTFRILDQTHVSVYVGGVLMALTTDYTVTDVGEATGGNIVFVATEEHDVTPALDAAIVISRNVPYTQEIDLGTGGTLDEITLENIFDKQTMMVQQLKDIVDSGIADLLTGANAPAASDGRTYLDVYSTGEIDAKFPNPLTIAKGGTGAATAAAARSSLSAAQSGANSDITSLNSGTIGIGTALPTLLTTVDIRGGGPTSGHNGLIVWFTNPRTPGQGVVFGSPTDTTVNNGSHFYTEVDSNAVYYTNGMLINGRIKQGYVGPFQTLNAELLVDSGCSNVGADTHAATMDLNINESTYHATNLGLYLQGAAMADNACVGLMIKSEQEAHARQSFAIRVESTEEFNAPYVGLSVINAATSGVRVGGNASAKIPTYLFEGQDASGNKKFEVDADGAEYAVSNNIYSDERLKEQINPLGNVLDTIMKLIPINFVFKDDPSKKVRTNFVAQAVETVIPEAVSLNPDGIYGINQGTLISYSIKAIQELTAKIKLLEDKLAKT